jgi:hypothetical protein
MVLRLPSELESALKQRAEQAGTNAQDLALTALRERFLPPAVPRSAEDRIELLHASIKDYGVSLPDSALTSEGIYDD